ncbi:prokaryotic cytochrome C oxidase subunit IV family protein [Pseudomaricurvus alkylphenolicus]|uniref:cytochrome C oxidase subunit IV family protein n=1 Tax=Pseudomaricurvus alkylphenolicus TaxID=1306991 RepID=UPI00142448D7|nr:cytochrome C oxidase subunit IV family protein [Pseudomaricurvus alkylphenolicus]NIB38826.1 prokaryotic cytochrome C oxidase subunit IV family protein [Pseudomaricurvus alkylphenolicus]
MKALIHTPITYVWLLLAVLTGLSWGLADGIAPDPQAAFQWVTVALMLLAFFKVHLVIMHFMEVGTAPIPLRAIFEVWVVVVCTAILLLYLGYI